MKKKRVYIILIAVLLGGIIFAISTREKENNKTKDTVAEVSDASSYGDIKLFLENTKKEAGIAFEIPKNESVQDYNTYYGNEILRILDSQNTDNVRKYADMAVSSEDFLSCKDGDIFEGIERIYYLQKLADGNNGNYHNSKMSDIVLELIEESYDEEGFFHYEEFDEYMIDMTEDEIKTIRLHHLMMTLHLCKQYGLLEEINVQSIEQYIADAVMENSNVIENYYAYLCYVYLDKETDIFSQLNITYDSEALDIIELNAYVSLANELGAAIEQPELIAVRMEAYVNECPMANMMELFIAVDTLEKLGHPVSGQDKNEIISMLQMYQNDDSTFPCISYYVLDNKQLLMHYEMTARMGLKSDILQYRQWLVKDLDKQDYYDLYAYAYFASRLGMDTSDLENKIISELGRCTLDNKSSIGYILMAMSELDMDLELDDCLNQEIVNYVELISSSSAVEYDVQDMILLYGAVKSGFININDAIVQAIINVNIEQAKPVEAVVIYYKYEMLKLAEEKFNKEGGIIKKDELEGDLLKLRCEGGFKMSEEDQFFDLQATYYLIKIIP